MSPKKQLRGKVENQGDESDVEPLAGGGVVAHLGFDTPHPRVGTAKSVGIRLYVVNPSREILKIEQGDGVFGVPESYSTDEALSASAKRDEAYALLTAQLGAEATQGDLEWISSTRAADGILWRNYALLSENLTRGIAPIGAAEYQAASSDTDSTAIAWALSKREISRPSAPYADMLTQQLREFERRLNALAPVSGSTHATDAEGKVPVKVPIKEEAQLQREARLIIFDEDRAKFRLFHTAGEFDATGLQDIGGIVKSGEAPKACALRNLLEHTGHTVTEDHLLEDFGVEYSVWEKDEHGVLMPKETTRDKAQIETTIYCVSTKDLSGIPHRDLKAGLFSTIELIEAGRQKPDAFCWYGRRFLRVRDAIQHQHYQRRENPKKPAYREVAAPAMDAAMFGDVFGKSLEQHLNGVRTDKLEKVARVDLGNDRELQPYVVVKFLDEYAEACEDCVRRKVTFTGGMHQFFTRDVLDLLVSQACPKVALHLVDVAKLKSAGDDLFEQILQHQCRSRKPDHFVLQAQKLIEQQKLNYHMAGEVTDTAQLQKFDTGVVRYVTLLAKLHRLMTVYATKKPRDHPDHANLPPILSARNGGMHSVVFALSVYYWTAKVTRDAVLGRLNSLSEGQITSFGPAVLYEMRRPTLERSEAALELKAKNAVFTPEADMRASMDELFRASPGETKKSDGRAHNKSIHVAAPAQEVSIEQLETDAELVQQAELCYLSMEDFLAAAYRQIPGQTYTSQMTPTTPLQRACFYAQTGRECHRLGTEGGCPYAHDPNIINVALIKTLMQQCTGAGPFRHAATHGQKKFIQDLALDGKTREEFANTLAYLQQALQERRN